MTLVTFMSDFGWKDHYVGAVKAAILKRNPTISIVDISHDIASFDIAQGAYVLRSVFRDFPPGTIHLVCIDPVHKEPSPLIALELEGHYFIGHDSGFFSLITDQAPTEVVRLEGGPMSSTFPGRDIMADSVVKLTQSPSLGALGTPHNELKRLFNRKVKATKREMVGHIIRVDKYGNLITNIEQKEFETIQRINGSVPYEIQVGREEFHNLNLQYDEVDSGNCFLIWNSLGLLEIGINKGNASELLGMKLDAPISIYFNI